MAHGATQAGHRGTRVSDERWEKVVELFERAVELPASEREQFLDAATRGDKALREELTAMLQADADSHPLFGMSVDGLAAVASELPALSLAGHSIGVYKLLREVGRGGMATVYEAEDTKHRRSVALKLLAADASEALRGERFRREIDVVAGLQHQNILPLYDSGEAEGLLYYVMPLVNGGTLRDRITRERQLPLGDVRRIVAQVAAGLDYAHRQGVVHRDVKPANILLSEDHAAIGDFGIAQRPTKDESLTIPGAFVGTPAYMSPEHSSEAAPVGARSDTYSLACVAFEMLTGHPPYQGISAAAVLAKHLVEPIPSAVSARADIPASVDAVLQRAMAKNPADRYATAAEFARAFDAALEPGAAVPAPARRALGSRRVVVMGAALLVVAAAALAARRLIPRRADTQSIVVLPFVNMSADSANEFFSDGVTEELTGALAQLGRVRVTPRTTAFAYKGRTGDIRKIGAELSVSRVLEGSVRRDGARVIFVTSLYDAASGERLWSSRYERDWGTVLALQTEIAGTIANQLQLRLAPEDRSRLRERHSVNADAYESYLKGRYFFDIRTSASLPLALQHFQRAIDIDSTYARAYAGMADTYSIMAWTGLGAPLDLFPRAERAAQRALVLDSTIAEAHVSLGIINTFHTWDWAAAEQATSRAIALDSTSAVAWFFRSWHLIARGRADEALASLKQARDLDRFSLITNARIGTLFSYMARWLEAEDALRATLELDPQYPVARIQLAKILSLRGRHNEAVQALPPDSVRFGSYESGVRGFVLARAGQRESALAALRDLQSRSYVPAEGVAAIYVALGQRDSALTWLEHAVASRGIGLTFLACEPTYAALRREPRYAQIVQKLRVVAPT